MPADDDPAPASLCGPRRDASGPTGVEMEALNRRLLIVRLTVYDMAKAIDRGMSIEGVWPVEKRGGKM